MELLVAFEGEAGVPCLTKGEVANAIRTLFLEQQQTRRGDIQMTLEWHMGSDTGVPYSSRKIGEGVFTA